MRNAALVAWALALLDLLGVLYLSPTSVSTTETTTGVAPIQTVTTSISFFDTLSVGGALMFFSIFALALAGCVFWCGALIQKSIR